MSFLQFLEQEPLALWITVTLLGLLVGSFLNVVIHRLPKIMERDWLTESTGFIQEYLPEDLKTSLQNWWQARPEATQKFSLAKPRSACPQCGHAITAIENIPVVSYLFLRGRCRGCQTPISLRYPLIEVLCGGLSFAVAWRFGYSSACLLGLCFVWANIALCFIDVDTMLLPDSITLPLLWLGLLYNWWGGFAPLPSAVLGATAGYLILWSVFWLFKFATGKDGMGAGDFKLLAAIGAWFGWQSLPSVILLSSIVGTIVGVSLIVFARHQRSKPIPFGPYLCAAGVLTLFFGSQMTGLMFG